MTDQEIFELYMAQSENVRELWKIRGSLLKDINFYTRRGDEYQVTVKTKFFSLLYSAWSEAQFIQILFTRSGFSYSEISHILNIKKKNGIAQAWDLMLTDAMRKVGNAQTRQDLNNRLKKLKSLTKVYIAEPSELRNKIAHGEWINAINNKANRVNPDIAKELALLDPVEIQKRFEVHRFFGYIVRDLVQSPKNSFHQHYWTNVVALEKYLRKTAGWNIQSKKQHLSRKPVMKNS
ncbi:hypothetical protein BDD21_3729 [Thiocapsa rosea]|uniref:Uncharacterized protein n=2 Tax=Thiocapsa rosea TaxID=69360 RepID=A0A495VA14_9GAMM|nr:hypothetical protein BDD21_3729 [Thiocapsa rosea]